MTALVSTADLGVRLGLGATIPAETLALMTQLLDDTTLVLEQLLRTSFDRAERTDIFELDSRRFKPFVGQDPWLATKQGFIDSTQTFEIYSALTIQELGTGSADDLSGVLTDYELGRIILGSSNYIGVVDRKLFPQEWDEHYVQVHYTAGFTATGGVYDNVPGWLQSIALTVAADVWRADGGCSKKGNCADSCAEAAKKYYARVADKIRFLPQAYSPLQSTVA